MPGTWSQVAILVVAPADDGVQTIEAV